MENKEENIKARIQKLLFMAIFIVGFLSGFSLLIPYVNKLVDERPIVSPNAEKIKTVLGESTKKREVIGFLPYWKIADKAPVYPQNLTQLIYFNVEANDKGDLLTTDKYGEKVNEWSYFSSDYFQDLKKQAKDTGVKVMVAITNFDIDSIDRLVTSKTATNTFISNLTSFVSDNDLDGINLDFEYQSDELMPDSLYYSRFLKKVKEELTKIKPNFVLSIDLMSNSIVKNPDYDLEKLAENVNQIIIMTYDYHHPGSETAGHVAPLYGGADERNVNEVISFTRSKILDNKIVMGIPLYGYEWETESSSYESPVIKDTPVAMATYSRIKELLSERPDIKMKWNDIAKSPWITFFEDGFIKQIYFENDLSLTHKMQYVAKNDLGGIALWALGYEGDFLNPWKIISRYL